MVLFPFGENVTRRRFTDGPNDRYGKPSRVPVDTILPELAAFNPGGTSEPAEVDRDSVTDTPNLYFTNAPDLTAQDDVQIRGEWFHVDGTPAVYRSPFDGVTGGVVVRLKRVSG